MDTERGAVGEWWPLKLKLLEANYEKSKLKIRESSLYCRLSIIEVQSIVDEEKLITEKYEKKAVAERLVVAKEEVAKHAKEKEVISKKAEDDLKRTEEEWKWKMTELTKKFMSLEEEKENEAKSKKVLVDEISTELGILKEKENEWKIENARLISKVQIMEKEHEKFSEIRRIQKVDKEVQAEASEVRQVYRRNGEGNMTETINKSPTITNIIPPKSPQCYQFEEKDQIMKNTEPPSSLPDARNETDGGKIDNNNRNEKGSSDDNMDAGGSTSRRSSSCQLNQCVVIEIPYVKDRGEVLRNCRKRSAAEAVECRPQRSRSASPQYIRSRSTGERSRKVRCDSETNWFRESPSVAKKIKKKQRRVTFSGELVKVREFDKDKEWEDTCQKDKQESGMRYYYLRKPYDRQRLEIDNSSVARDVLSVEKGSSTPQKDLLNDPSEVDGLKESGGVKMKEKLQKLRGEPVETRNGSVAQIDLLNHPNEGDSDSSEVKVSRGNEMQEKVPGVANVRQSKKERVSEGSGSSNVSSEGKVVKNQRKRELKKNVSKDSSKGGESVEGTKISGESGVEEKSSEDCEVQTYEVIHCPEEKVNNKHGRDENRNVMRKTPKCKAKWKADQSGARQACRKTPRRAAKERAFLDNVGSIKKWEHIETEDVQEIKKRKETPDSGQYCSKHESHLHGEVEIDDMGGKEATMNRSGRGGMEGIEEEIEHGDVQENEVAEIKETRRTKRENCVAIYSQHRKKETVYERESKDFNEGGILNGKKTPKKRGKESGKQGKTKEALLDDGASVSHERAEVRTTWSTRGKRGKLGVPGETEDQGIQTDEDTLKEALHVEMDDQLPVVLNCQSTSNGESFGNKANDGDQHEMKKRETRQRGSNRMIAALNEQGREVDDTKETHEGKDGTKKESPTRDVVSLNETTEKENKVKKSRKTKEMISAIDDISEEIAKIPKENYDVKSEESPTRELVSLNETREEENKEKAARRSRKAKRKIPVIDDRSEEAATISKEKSAGKTEESLTRNVSLNETRGKENKEKAARRLRKAKRKIPVIDDRSEEAAEISKENKERKAEESPTRKVVSLNETTEKENKVKKSRKTKEKISAIDDISEEIAKIPKENYDVKTEESLTRKLVPLNETREEENKEKAATWSRKAKRKIPVIDDRSEEAATISKEKSAGKTEESLTRKVVSLNETREEENKEKAATWSRKAKRKIPVIDDRSEEAATISKEKSAGKTEESLTRKVVSLNETTEEENKEKAATRSRKVKRKIPVIDDRSEEAATISKEKSAGKTEESLTRKVVSLNETTEEENKEKAATRSRKVKGKIQVIDDRSEESATISKEKSAGKTEESLTRKVVSLNETTEEENEEKAATWSRKAKRKIPVIDDRSEEAATISKEKSAGKTGESLTRKVVSLNETTEEENKEKAATRSRKVKGKIQVIDDRSEEAATISKEKSAGKTEESLTRKVVSLNETTEEENEEKAATRSRKAKRKIPVIDDRSEEAATISKEKSAGKTEESLTRKVVSLNETTEGENEEKAATWSRKAKRKIPVIDDRSEESAKISKEKSAGKREEKLTGKDVSLNETKEQENKVKKSRKAKEKILAMDDISEEVAEIAKEKNYGKTKESPTIKYVSLNEIREEENKEKAPRKSRKAKGKIPISHDRNEKAAEIPKEKSDGKTEESPTRKAVLLNETREKENKEKGATKCTKDKGKIPVIDDRSEETAEIPGEKIDGKTEECPTRKVVSLNETREKENEEKAATKSRKAKGKTLVIEEAAQIPQKESDGKTKESREKRCRNKESSLNDEKGEKDSEVSEKKEIKTRHRTVKGGIVGSRKGTQVDKEEEVRRLKDTRGDKQTVVTLSRKPLRNETSLSCEPERDDREKDGEIKGIDEDKENLDVGERKKIADKESVENTPVVRRSQSTDKGVTLIDETRYDDNGEKERREVASQRGEIRDMTEQNQEMENKVEKQQMKDSMETPEKRKKRRSSFVVNDKSLSNEAMFEHKTQAGDQEEEVVVTRTKRNVSGIINEVTKNNRTSLGKTASNLERTVGSSNATISQQTGNTALDLHTTMNASKPAAKKRRRTLYSAKENSRMTNTTSSFFQETLSRNNTRTSGGMPPSLSSFMQAFIVPKLKK